MYGNWVPYPQRVQHPVSVRFVFFEPLNELEPLT